MTPAFQAAMRSFSHGLSLYALSLWRYFPPCFPRKQSDAYREILCPPEMSASFPRDTWRKISPQGKSIERKTLRERPHRAWKPGVIYLQILWILRNKFRHWPSSRLIAAWKPGVI